MGYQGSGNTGFIIGSWMGLPTEGKPGGHLLVPLQCVRASVRAGWGGTTCRCRSHRENEAVEVGLCLAAGWGPQCGKDRICGSLADRLLIVELDV